MKGKRTNHSILRSFFTNYTNQGLLPSVERCHMQFSRDEEPHFRKCKKNVNKFRLCDVLGNVKSFSSRHWFHFSLLSDVIFLLLRISWWWTFECLYLYCSNQRWNLPIFTCNNRRFLQFLDLAKYTCRRIAFKRC